MSIYSDLGYISNIVTGEFFSLNLPIYIYMCTYTYIHDFILTLLSIYIYCNTSTCFGPLLAHHQTVKQKHIKRGKHA